LVFVDHGGAVFLRVDDTTRGIARRLHVDLDARLKEIAMEPRDRPVLPEWLGGVSLPYPMFNLGLFLYAAGRPDLAAAEARRLWEHPPTEQLAIIEGDSAASSGLLPASLARLEDALDRFPESAHLGQLVFLGLGYRADALLGQGNAKEAERDLRRMITLNPASWGPYCGLAKASFLQGNERQAREWLGESDKHDANANCRRAAVTDPVLHSLLGRD
jgi:tetratricopeptide (TPR) repeat protein